MAFLGKWLKPLFSTCKRIALLEYSMVSIHLTKNEFGFFSTINNLFKYFTCNNLPIGNELFLQAIKCLTTASFWKTLKNWKVSLASFKMCMCAPVQQCTGAKIILNSTYIHTCSMDSSSNYFICDDKKNFTLASLIVPQSVSSWKRTH